VEVARVEEVGSSGKASLLEKVVLLAVEAGAIKDGSGFLPSRRVLGRAITACDELRSQVFVVTFNSMLSSDTQQIFIS
jgi:hypothetical protein